MCGMCLPACPTYQVYQTEAESPRGRISIIQAYAQGRLQPDATLLRHLDHCLGCMACAAMCPSQVDYGRLIDHAQTLLASQRPDHPGSLKLLLHQTRRKGGLKRYATALSWYNRSGLQKLAGAILGMAGDSRTARANAILGLAQPARLKPLYRAAVTAIGDVALFTGCLGSSFDGETLQAAIKVLNQFGYNVHIPPDQQCCGALHQHHGQPEQAQQLSQLNRQAFGNPAITHIIYTANGCGAQLAQHNPSRPVIDIMSFLAASPGREATRFKPLATSVYLHESCSSTNKLKIRGIMQQLLRCIPQLQCHTPATAMCCGAGGSHQLLFPELSAELLKLKLPGIRETRAHYLLSDNLGCALHFKQGLERAGIHIEVIHPITLLARQLD